MTSYLTSMDTISLSRTVFEIFDFKVFRVWPWPFPRWPLGVEGRGQTLKTLKSNISKTVRDREMLSVDFLFDFYGHHLSISYVSEIFDFKVFRVWPWPLKIIWGQKIYIPFKSSYMTSYLTSTDNISLSRTVFEIFDFKVFRVWPRPSTPKGHLGSKNVYHSKAHI